MRNLFAQDTFGCHHCKLESPLYMPFVALNTTVVPLMIYEPVGVMGHYCLYNAPCLIGSKGSHPLANTLSFSVT